MGAKFIHKDQFTYFYKQTLITSYRPRTATLCGLRIGSNLKTSWARSCSFEWLLMLTILAVCFENSSELKVQDLKACNCCCKSADAACLTGLRLASFFEASFWLMNCIWTHQWVCIKIQSLWSLGFDLMIWWNWTCTSKGIGLFSNRYVKAATSSRWIGGPLAFGRKLQTHIFGQKLPMDAKGIFARHLASCHILSHPVTSCVSCWICWISYTSTELEFQWNLLVVDILHLSQNDLCKTQFQYDATKNIHT